MSSYYLPRASYLLLPNYSKTSRLKTTHFIISQFVWVRKPGVVQPGPLVHNLSRGCNHKVLTRAPGCDLIWRLNWERIPFQAHTTASRIWFLKSCWTEDLNSLPATGQRPPWIPCHVSLSTITTCIIKASNRESASRAKVTISCNLIMEGTAHHICCIVRSKSLGSAHTQGEGFTQGYE